MTDILIICHKGEIETKTLFLVFSIRKFLTGDYRIIIAEPSEIEKPSPITIDLLNGFMVEYHGFSNPVLKKEQKNFIPGDLVSNKLFAVATYTTENPVLFLDSDTCFVKPCHVDEIALGNLFRAKPANRSNISDWEGIFENFNINSTERSIKTSLDKKIIPPYFNAGVLILPGKIRKEFIEKCIEFFHQLSDKKLMQHGWYKPFNRDQLAIALAIEKHRYDFNLLDERFNFPIRSKFKKRKYAVLVHYHTPYTLAINKNLKKQFLQFLIKDPRCEVLLKGYKTWEVLFIKKGFTAFLFKVKNIVFHFRYLLKIYSHRMFHVF